MYIRTHKLALFKKKITELFMQSTKVTPVNSPESSSITFLLHRRLPLSSFPKSLYALKLAIFHINWKILKQPY